MAPKSLLVASVLALLVLSCAAHRGGPFGGGGFGRDEWRGLLNGTLGTPVGSLKAFMNGSQVLDASGAAVGDANATGIIGLVVLKTDTDYNILYQAGVRVTDAGLPTSIAINSDAAGAGGSPVIEFSATEAAWQNYTWNGTRFGRFGQGNQGAALKAVVKVLSQWFPNLNSTGAGSFFGGRGGPRGPPSGFAYGFSGVWYNASTITNSGGRSYADVVAVDMLAAPESFYGVVKTDAFADGVVGGAFANHTMHGGRGGRGGRGGARFGGWLGGRRN
ncbi:hypothetical protein CLOM_g1107 [Closterium sp. NIES-68]|nr:hypothetical protein CLOM_g1107 [Closterium sp. NIES-68]GJP73667.1 hypothetical protein CLOP_g4362 [Closterium sp. NIES-67]